ncbi:aspartate 1-decarboxylase [Streptococcus anginosus]|jgi:aspartate 1-decarboxylase|uniref:Aspartate 1-decarboxylase n=1 Tax=Streptococcus anginosus TaxID=1328 RepID=A0A412PQA6_STRAP|nr:MULTISPECIES: aspartate 1-decarboxylase [Streptococcus]EMG33427.1 aspartate alpha-decarboxylase [Streptococcus oralis subsp. tigurinus AZ_3a]KAA9246562.1 aspartate 1-decarboxylase [Streptococcus anginosus]KAA9268218.1 aspartate 1-decarboxylase [Streptococcus anginosus]MCW0928357.1 aspartate 1-decarboxylase [Streptococcus anginosus]MCW0986925.1 aspartate 1-decarboxylase [Streptococcus anginosus]
MLVDMLKGKIHRATVVQAELDYVGSITIDKALMDASNILEYEKVQIVDVNNGNRFETYVIAGPRNSGIICLNGAAARCVSVNDKIIIMCYCQMTPEEAKDAKPYVVLVNDNNEIIKEVRYEKYGVLSEELVNE